MNDVVIAPSILAADCGRLNEEIKEVEKATSYLHIDVMDGHYVPNLTFGVPVVESIRKNTNMIFDVHLMVTNPMDFFKPFADAGADMLTFHVETVEDPDQAIAAIRALGKRAGISIHPDTPIEKAFPYVTKCDLVLVMSVRPGFGGQHFMTESLDRIAAVRRIIDENNADTVISVDGGICDETAPLVVKAGASYLVAGSRVFSNSDHSSAVKELLTCALS